MRENFVYIPFDSLLSILNCGGFRNLCNYIDFRLIALNLNDSYLLFSLIYGSECLRKLMIKIDVKINMNTNFR